MKALILTNALVIGKEKELINNSNILKIAVNHTDYKADFRVARDCWQELKSWYQRTFKEKLIFLDEIEYKQADNPNTNDNKELYFCGGTITTAIDFAIKQGATDILLVADNKVYTKDFQDCVNVGIDKLKKHANIYKYSKDGNFNLEYINIKDFINA